MTTRFLRIGEITRPRGPIGKSKLYSDARAGLIELRKIGGMTVVTEVSWLRYLQGEPMDQRTQHVAA